MSDTDTSHVPDPDRAYEQLLALSAHRRWSRARGPSVGIPLFALANVTLLYLGASVAGSLVGWRLTALILAGLLVVALIILGASLARIADRRP